MAWPMAIAVERTGLLSVTAFNALPFSRPPVLPFSRPPILGSQEGPAQRSAGESRVHCAQRRAAGSRVVLLCAETGAATVEVAKPQLLVTRHSSAMCGEMVKEEPSTKLESL